MVGPFWSTTDVLSPQTIGVFMKTLQLLTVIGFNMVGLAIIAHENMRKQRHQREKTLLKIFDSDIHF